MNRVVLIIQARSGSTRLPGKVCRDLLPGKSLLACLLERVQRSSLVSEIVVATTVLPADDQVEAIARQCGMLTYRGSEPDVLERFAGALDAVSGDFVVRICADSPVHDAAVIDAVVGEALRDSSIDYVSNMHPESFPYGMAVEVMPSDVLRRLDRVASELQDREHVTSYIAKHSHLFRVHNVAHTRDLSALRFVVDYPEDLELAQKIYAHFGNTMFDWLDAVSLLEQQPQLSSINVMHNDRLIKQ